MIFSRILSLSVIVACLSATAVFAVPEKQDSPGINMRQQKVNHCKFKFGDKEQQVDPIKALENKKEKINTLLKENKISKEKADAMIARIDAKLKKINEFNKLAPQQKKEKLINDFKSVIEKRIKDGRLDRNKGDELIKDFTEKVNNWDGKGYPMFHKRGFKLKR